MANAAFNMQPDHPRFLLMLMDIIMLCIITPLAFFLMQVYHVVAHVPLYKNGLSE